MTALTLIRSVRPPIVCKSYRRAPDGTIAKAAVAHVTEGTGRTVSAGDAAAMVALLRDVTESRDLVLCNGTFRDAANDDFRLVAEAELARLTGTEIGRAPGGVQAVAEERIAARLKRGIEPAAWLLLDCDNPPGIPDDWKAMGIAERLALLDPIMPGLGACERIELRSSSARVHRPGEAPGARSHAWVRVSCPDLIETMRAAVRVRMVTAGLSFPTPRYSRTEPEKVIGHEHRTVVDLATWDRGRLAFCARPEVAPDTGLVVADADVVVVNEGGGPFDNGAFTLPGASDLAGYAKRTGRTLRIRRGAAGITTDEWGALTLETEIEARGEVRTLAAWCRDRGSGWHMRCETPFRASVSEAAFIRIGPDGQPFLHDVGTGTTYHLAREAAAEDAAAENSGRQGEAAPDPQGATWPPFFVMRGDGLFFETPPKRNPQTGEEVAGAPMRLAAPFRVLGEARDGTGHGRAILLEWADADRRVQRFPLPRRMLHGDHGALAGELEDRGLRVRTGPTYRAKLAEALAGVRTPHKIAAANRTGWHAAGGRMAYVMADGTAHGEGAERVILAGAGEGSAARVAPAGTLQGWQDGVAAPAVGNHRLALYIAAAFAAPLLEVIGVEGGGVHLLGGSSTGKSTCLEAAASAWGSPRMGQQVRSWRATANALEGAAVECSDALLALDEIGLCDGRDVAAALYMLAGGAGRGRADRNGALRASRTWRTLFLSTGEVSPADKIAEAGQRSRAGQDVRCVSVPADAGAGRGVWQVLHGHPSGEALSNAVKAAALAHHGHAARAFVKALAKMRADQPADLLRGLQDAIAAFGRGKHVPADADGQVRRVAQRFGLIAAAGDLAADLGILPWPEGEAERAAVACFTAWLTARGGHGAAEDREALTAVRAFIGAHGASRFSTLLLSTEQGSEVEEDSTRPVVNRAGWRRRTMDGWEYLILPEVWRGEVCRGLDHQHVAREVDAARFLQRGEGKNLAARVRVPGEGLPRLYIILPGLLAGEGA